jgi:signal transduction histidine kinase
MTVEAMHDVDRDLERDREVSRYDLIGMHHPELDDLVALAAQTTDSPVAAINLMNAGTQTTVAAVGLATGVCDREDSMCDIVLYAGHPVEVPDASLDPRWADHPHVNGELGSFRFYYSHQLVSPRGIVVGTLCLFDYVRRELEPEQHFRLDKIARWIVDILELRLRTRELEDTVLELTRARDELERSNAMLGTFAGQVAHDLRGPVSAVTASLGMLREDPTGLDADQAWLLERAVGSVGRMDQLIGDMLAFASVGGRGDQGDVDLAELLLLVRDDLAADLEGVHLVAKDLPLVTGDLTQWRVVLQNLVANAVKFTRGRSTSPLVRVSAGVEAGRWWLEVADNGPGVPAKDRSRVFGLMTQGDPSHEGIGLGLATCQRIVDANGGTIRIDAAPEGGALVRVVVPVP